jgi:hypothetical protein
MYALGLDTVAVTSCSVEGAGPKAERTPGGHLGLLVVLRSH